MGGQEIIWWRDQGNRKKQKKDTGTVYLTRKNWKKNYVRSSQKNNHEGAEKIKDPGEEGVLAAAAQLLH